MMNEEGCGLCSGTADVIVEAMDGYYVLPDGMDDDDVKLKIHHDDEGNLSFRVMKWVGGLTGWRGLFEYFPKYCPHCGRQLRDD